MFQTKVPFAPPLSRHMFGVGGRLSLFITSGLWQLGCHDHNGANRDHYNCKLQTTSKQIKDA